MGGLLVIKAETVGWSSAKSKLDQLTRGMSDFRGEVWPYLRQDFYAFEMDLFETQGAALGGWPPNSPRYAERKAQLGGGHRVLHFSGRLEDSLTGPSGDGVMHETKDTLELGTDVPYAVYHMHGSSKRLWIPSPVSMWTNGYPARPMVPDGPDIEDRWVAVADTAMERLIERLGLDAA